MVPPLRFALAVLAAIMLAGVFVMATRAQGIVPIWPAVELNGCTQVQGLDRYTYYCNAGTISTAIASVAPNETVNVTIDNIDCAGASNCQGLSSSNAAFVNSWPANASGATGSPCEMQFADSGTESCHFVGQSVGFLHQLTFAVNQSIVGVMITVSPDAVQPSPTPINTPLPSSPYPTSTPYSISGGTNTPTGTVVAATATPTITATPLPDYNCGDVTFPLLNCTYRDGYNGSLITGPIPNVRHWSSAGNGNAAALPEPDGSANCSTHCAVIQGGTEQAVVAGATGEAFVLFGSLNAVTPDEWFTCISGNTCTDISGSLAYTNHLVDLGPVTAGTSYTFLLCETSTSTNCIQNGAGFLSISNIWVGGSANTPTPVNTGTPTSTPTRGTGTPTNTPRPSATRYPFLPTFTPTIPPTPTVPGTATPCPGGCAVTQLSPLPAILNTVIIIPTGPLTYLTGLSLGRTPCTSFGNVPILVPHITPVGSLTPLAYDWGPVTPIAMSTISVNTGPISGTSIIPCADPNIPTEVWDLTYYGGVVGLFIVFLGWLVWFIHRIVNNQGTAD